MTVATDLQNLSTDVSAAIAAGKSWGRVELEKLRRQIGVMQRDQRRATAKGVVDRIVFDDLCAAIERGTADIAGAARHAQSRVAR